MPSQSVEGMQKWSQILGILLLNHYMKPEYYGKSPLMHKAQQFAVERKETDNTNMQEQEKDGIKTNNVNYEVELVTSQIPVS